MPCPSHSATDSVSVSAPSLSEDGVQLVPWSSQSYQIYNLNSQLSSLLRQEVGDRCYRTTNRCFLTVRVWGAWNTRPFPNVKVRFFCSVVTARNVCTTVTVGNIFYTAVTGRNTLCTSVTMGNTVCTAVTVGNIFLHSCNWKKYCLHRCDYGEHRLHCCDCGEYFFAQL